MSPKCSGETASACASWSWMVYAFTSGMFFATFIIGMLLYWKPSLEKKFWGLLCCPPSSHLDPVNQRLTSSQSSSRPSSQPVYRYDVFLSFRGIDTRNTFIDHLYKRLTEKCIFITFKDDEELETGEPIQSQLTQAIEDSRAAIVVFSSHYADSTWCLTEMAAIADRHRESKQIVIPVFYNVPPFNVRYHTGAYEDAFVSLNGRFGEDPGKVQRWKDAMTYLANLSGHDVRDKSETKEMENIIQDVIDKLGHKLSANINDVIGIQSHVEELERLLKLSSEDDDFQILGIWGMVGIGKTVHATVLYNKISYQFNACCFIKDVSEIYRKQGRDGANEVQKIILQQTVQEKYLERWSHTDITGILQKRLCNQKIPKKVLIVLDNVDDLEQWEALAINPTSLGRGSRVIITSRNEHILSASGANKIYEVPLLNDNDALELFLRKAFKKGCHRPSSISDVTLEILKYAQSLPLAIEALGYAFNSLGEELWEQALERWRKYPDKNFVNELQISYDELNPNERKIFLDIACFFGGKRKEYVEHILDSCGISSPQYVIHQMRRKSLITIRNQEIHMHRILQELGKKIVQGQYPEEPKYWTRLWHHKDFEEVLMSDLERNNVKAIVLDEEDVSKSNHLRIEGLSKMGDLELLILHHKNFSKDLNFLFKGHLRYLFWHGYPSSSLSLSIWYNLVELNLPDTSIQRLWEDNEIIPKLKRVDLRNSKNLTKTPNFECCQGLMQLDLTGCTNLTQVHESIGLLTKLDCWSLRDCRSLTVLDLNTSCELSSLKVLHLSGCTNLKYTPDFRGLSNLKYLDLEGCTSLSTVHESIGALAMLKFLSLRGCTSLKDTPDFRGLSNLEYLDLEQCTSLSTVHESIEALAMLKFLSLRGCTNLVEIPNNVNNIASLLILDLRGCIMLRNLPLGQKVMSSSCLRSLIFLYLGFCELRGNPGAIGELRCLEGLNLERSYFSYVPDNIKKLSKLAYLNLAAHYRELVRFPKRQFDSLHQGRGILEQYPHPIIIGQDNIFSATATSDT